jgi:hypothetical protein
MVRNVAEERKPRSSDATDCINSLSAGIASWPRSRLRPHNRGFKSHAGFVNDGCSKITKHVAGGGLNSFIFVRAARKTNLDFRVARQRHLVVDQ